MEPILNPDGATISPNDHTVVIIKAQIYSENAVRGLLQPSDLLHDSFPISDD